MFNNTSLQGNTNKRNTMNYHLSAVRRAIITNTKDWFWQRQNATFTHYWLECKLVCVKQYGASFKKLYYPTIGCIALENEMGKSKKTFVFPHYSTTIHNNQETVTI